LKSKEKYKNNKEDDEEDDKRVKLELGEELNPLTFHQQDSDNSRVPSHL
jgi:hypothetical protein